MLDFILFFLHRIGLWMGLLLTGSSLFFAGLKLYEHVIYLPTQARVVGLSTKCEMSYRVAGRLKSSEIVACSDVARVKAGSPDVDWKVEQIVFVDLAFAVDSHPVRTTARLGKLERSKVAIGEIIPVLRSPDNPQVVTGPVHPGLLLMMSVVFGIGLMLLAVSWWAKRRREAGALAAPATYAVAGTFGQHRPAN